MRVDKGKGGSSGADDEGFYEVKKKKSSGNNAGTKNFKPLLVKPKVQYRPKVIKRKSKLALRQLLQLVRRMYSFEAMNVDDPIIMEVKSGNKASMSGAQEEGNNEDGKSLETGDYSGDLGSEDEVEPGDNEMASFLAKPSRVGYVTKSLLEQWRETYSNAEQECDYDPYDDDIYEGQVIPGNIQTIFNNLDIK
ncbi:hypothetical protein Tco_1161011, partial [Tanacetum coccineum]